MKRVLAFILCLATAFCLLSACGNTADGGTPSNPTETTPAPTETPEEAEVLKIMILGSSRSINTFQMLWNAFNDQMPEQKVVLGVMYYSGCSISEHVNFISNNQAVYRYYYNDSGRWITKDDVTMDVGLADQAWDVIFLQAGDGDTANKMNESGRKYLVDYVNSIIKTPHTFWWHSTWFNATDPDLYDDAKKAEAYSVDQIAQLTATNDAAKKYVLDDPMFAGHITSGTPMMYALKELGLTDKDLFRDHTHLSDYGYILIAYAFCAQFTGKPVTEINIDSIPAHLRHKNTQSEGDLILTEDMKQAIIKTVDYTLKNPWAVPTGQ